MRNAMHLWLLLYHPKYADTEDLNLDGRSDVVYYSRQGRGFIREINVSQNPNRPSIAERDAYRSRLRETTVPFGESTGRMVGQAREFNMLLYALKKSARGLLLEECAPFRPVGGWGGGLKTIVKIAEKEEQRMKELQTRLRACDERREEEEGPHVGPFTGEPNYSRRRKRSWATRMGTCELKCTAGGVHVICLYRCGAKADVGVSPIHKQSVLGAQSCLDDVANRSVVDEAIGMLLSSLSDGAKICTWQVGRCGRYSAKRERYRRGLVLRGIIGVGT